jgi:hypothetical protein
MAILPSAVPFRRLRVNRRQPARRSGAGRKPPGASSPFGCFPAGLCGLPPVICSGQLPYGPPAAVDADFDGDRAKEASNDDQLEIGNLFRVALGDGLDAFGCVGTI